MQKTVLDAARERISTVFDHFEMIVVSYSGGKDSTVLLHLAREEARRRGRQIHALFIDLEAQYNYTIKHIEETMLGDPYIIPVWVCLPLNLRNAVSVFQPHWCCWDPEEKKNWVRPMPQHEGVLSDPSGLPFWRHRMEFEEFIVKFPEWFSRGNSYSSMVGICADESLNRYCAIATSDKKCAWRLKGKQIKWSAVMDAKAPNVVAHYPIYDWAVSDIWKYHAEAGIRHNEIYDLMHLCGLPLTEQRICQPYGDDQRKGLDLWAQCEPETWHIVLDRVVGVNYGARYARDKLMGYHRGLGLPEGHTWKSYTFLLLSTVPDVLRERYISNFAVFLEWWQRHGYPELGKVHDDETAYIDDSGHRRLPSWRRLAMCVLKNDFLAKSLSIGQVKNVHEDVYDRVKAGKPVKVRKSVEPVYAQLRELYRKYMDGGIEKVDADLAVPRLTARIAALNRKVAEL
ncbi:MAG: DUF3440 domain-containing protein, partial [Synergistaceae bacterium]|jgi:predicted phosphoadenosine phosphosulfate sulfurtransferase|nr:DUF3440 domain-containing protein [Synergistaceae bacterium]